MSLEKGMPGTGDSSRDPFQSPILGGNCQGVTDSTTIWHRKPPEVFNLKITTIRKFCLFEGRVWCLGLTVSGGLLVGGGKWGGKMCGKNGCFGGFSSFWRCGMEFSENECAE